jgi:hypothetical protein
MRQNEGMIRIFTWYALESSRFEFSDNVSKCVWKSDNLTGLQKRKNYLSDNHHVFYSINGKVSESFQLQ